MICNQRTKRSFASIRLIGPLQSPRGACLRLVGVLLATAALAASAQAEEPFQPCANTADGITLERRAVPGSKFYEYRATAVAMATPEVVLRSIWNGNTEQLPATVKQRTVLSTSDTTMLFYDQIKTKVVSDRDYTLRFTWQRNPQTGVIEVPFVTANELGPAPAPGHVRVPIIRGDWIITPIPAAAAAEAAKTASAAAVSGESAAAAATRITYLCYSEPGGSIPAFMARGAQQDQVLIDIRRIVGRAQHPAPKTAAR